MAANTAPAVREDPTSATAAQRDTLATQSVHEDWESSYRSRENEVFYEAAFDRLLELVDAQPDGRFVDVGCGPGFHAIRLARRGFRVLALDFSPSVLEMAAANVKAAGLGERIEVRWGDLLDLGLADGSEQCVLCWGVLMHVPQVDRAIAELARVTAPGGTLVVSEGNFKSLEDVVLAINGRLRGGSRPRRTSAGLEAWHETPAGPLLTRRADIPWLVREFAAHGLVLKHRLPGQLTELYIYRRLRPLRGLLHRLNRIWARVAPTGALAYGNILIFHKPAESS
jgi:SAM-dependent methyltransferase